MTYQFWQFHFSQSDFFNWIDKALAEVSRNSKYGFLAASEVDGLGFCGGLLILSVGGRPIEFHCTAPVTANRAQEILYGKTLNEFLLCDQIGVSLLDKAKAKLDIVIVDQADLCPLQSAYQLPLVLTGSSEHEFVATGQGDVRVGEDEGAFEIVGPDIDGAEKLLELFNETLPLSEPFERIYSALGEARGVAA